MSLMCNVHYVCYCILSKVNINDQCSLSLHNCFNDNDDENNNKSLYSLSIVRSQI